MFTFAKRGLSVLPFLLALAVLIWAPTGQATHLSLNLPLPAPTPPAKPGFTGYKGISIGTPSSEVRTLLGQPARGESDTEEEYSSSEFESARVFYDENKNVRTISILYTGDLRSAPTPKAVLGTEIEPNSDGGMHKMVQFPKSGFWISYVKTGGDGAMVMITIQKMARES